jgi:ATP-binding cassette subfamily B (MDR/TAP) protein 1
MDLSKPEIHWIIIGCLASIVFGAGTPFFAILFGDMLKLFTYEASEAMKQARIYALAFGGVGFAFLLSMAIQGWMFSISGQRLTERVRIYMFSHMLKQEMGWFDQDKNNTGALCARLSNNAEAISGATGAKGQIISEGFFVSSNIPKSKRNFLEDFCPSL